MSTRGNVDMCEAPLRANANCGKALVLRKLGPLVCLPLASQRDSNGNCRGNGTGMPLCNSSSSCSVTVGAEPIKAAGSASTAREHLASE